MFLTFIQTTWKHSTVSRAVARILQISRLHVLALLGGLINELSLTGYTTLYMWLVTFIYPVCLWPGWVSSSMDICRLKPCSETWAWSRCGCTMLYNTSITFMWLHQTCLTPSHFSDTTLLVCLYWLFHWWIRNCPSTWIILSASSPSFNVPNQLSRSHCNKKPHSTHIPHHMLVDFQI